MTLPSLLILCVCAGSVLITLTFLFLFFFFKQKTAYEMRISDWSSDVCSSDLVARQHVLRTQRTAGRIEHAQPSPWRIEVIAVDPDQCAARAIGGPVRIQDRKSTRLNSSH